MAAGVGGYGVVQKILPIRLIVITNWRSFPCPHRMFFLFCRMIRSWGGRVVERLYFPSEGYFSVERISLLVWSLSCVCCSSFFMVEHVQDTLHSLEQIQHLSMRVLNKGEEDSWTIIRQGLNNNKMIMNKVATKLCRIFIWSPVPS